MRFTSLIVAAGLLGLILGCGNNDPPKDKAGPTDKAAPKDGKSPPSDKASQRLTGGGSSFVAPMMEKWASAYKKARDVEVDYTSSGSGNGVSNMIDQKNDFGCTDAPMNDEQMKLAAAKGGEVVHVPLVMGAVVPFYNLPEVDKPLKFTGSLLADLYLGKIAKWNDPAIKALNPEVNLPDLKITVIYRSDKSGTSYIWTDYLAKVSVEWKEKVGASTSPKWPTGQGATKNDGVAGAVSRTKGAVGYVELIYALGKKNLKIGLVENREKEFVEASLESVSTAAASLKAVSDDLRQIPLTDVPGKGVYPICGTTWLVAYVKQPVAKAETLKAFATWCTHEGQDMTQDLHYAKVPANLQALIEKQIARIEAK